MFHKAMLLCFCVLMVALYTFEGNANDVSGHGHDGTLNGDPQFVAGHDGSALECDGIDNYVSTGKTASDLGIGGNNPRTVSAWVFTRSYNNGGIFCGLFRAVKIKRLTAMTI